MLLISSKASSSIQVCACECWLYARAHVYSDTLHRTECHVALFTCMAGLAPFRVAIDHMLSWNPISLFPEYTEGGKPMFKPS